MHELKRKTTKYFFKENDFLLADSNKKYILRIKDLQDEDRPREKLLKYGAQDLSATELLAVILGIGTRKEEVLSMTSRILKEYGEKNISNQKDARILSNELNIPLIKACQIVACFELGRRFFKQGKGQKITIRTARQVYEYLKDMRDLKKEQLRGLYLNSRYNLIHDEVISIGTLTSNIVHPREVFKPALEYSAAAIIIAHNHPSGSIKPSQGDIQITNQLLKASKIIGIDLLDHIIIAGNKFMSVPAEYDN